MQPDGSELVQLTTTGDRVTEYALSPDGTKIAVYDSVQKRVVVLPANGSTSPPLTLVDTALALGDEDPVKKDLGQCIRVDLAWSPDGGAVSLACGSWPGCADFGVPQVGSGLWVVNADGSGLTAVPNVAKEVLDPLGGRAETRVQASDGSLHRPRSMGG